MSTRSRPGCTVVLKSGARFDLLDSFQSVLDLTRGTGAKPEIMPVAHFRMYETQKGIAIRTDMIEHIIEGGY